MFELDYRLENDCVGIGSLPLCTILLMKDANYPWLILVPQRSDVSEIYQLDADDQEQLIWESSFIAERLMAEFDGDKMNIAALGNVVPQLHIHHVVRTRSDAAWPKPVWGALPAQAYAAGELEQRVAQLAAAFVTSTFKPA
ncbi:HIT domain-containing protein [Reinekea sp.]|jgi:diadenosine tetraphosphate (Ap4A) HIT family hydrolase|uniref:HIT domain-containing protein n=1 Tax=Reinekea sp. TaxID=1970455 RepID=UPI002A81ED2C|nr:HIT domain-containing protein [Reinekea sp.]